VTPVPKEQCDLKPFKICTVEMISFPSLELVNECVQVPKEVCSLEKVNAFCNNHFGNYKYKILSEAYFSDAK
jgi:hypothetical protein